MQYIAKNQSCIIGHLREYLLDLNYHIAQNETFVQCGTGSEIEPYE